MFEEVCIEITNKCPMRCVHCSTNSVSNNIRPSFMNLEILNKTLNSIKKLGCKILEISGGEPLIHPNLYDFLKMAMASSVEVYLYTAGSLLKQRGSICSIGEDDVQNLLMFNIRKFILNLEGASDFVHDSFVGRRGSFVNAIKSIENLSKADAWIGVHFVPTKLNYFELEKLVKVCYALGVREVGILRFVPQGKGYINKNLLELNKIDFMLLAEKIVQLKQKYNGRINIRTGCPLNFCSLLNNEKPVPCKAGKSTLYISWNGNVIPCPAFKDSRDFLLGNIYNESLEEILNSYKFKLLSDFDATKIKGECSSCDILNECEGRCLAQRLIAHSDIYKGPDPMCFKEFMPINVREEYA